MTEAVPRLGIGMVGYAFMGVAHSQAWRNAPRFFDLPLRPDMAVVAGRDEAAVTAAAAKLGWSSAETDWKALVARDDVDLVDICTPGDTHAEIAIAALEAGKHVLCEKPLANSVQEAEAMVRAAEASTGLAMVGLHLPPRPRHPAGPHARRGRPDRHGPARARAVPAGLDRRPAGAAVVAAGQAEGRLRGARRHRRAHRRPRPVRHRRVRHGRVGGAGDVRQGAPDRFGAQRAARHAGTETGPVTVDDAAIFLGRMSGGGLATFEATRFAWGRKNAIRLEINGSHGSLAFDFEDMNVLHYFDASRERRGRGVPPDRRDRARARLRVGVVAGGSRPRATSTRSPTRRWT